MGINSPVLGVDGCRVGWVCGLVVSDEIHIEVVETFADVWAFAESTNTTRLLVDIPIGLPETGRRTCDSLAREAMGARASTVFFAPVRGVLDAPTHGVASERNREQTGYGLSIQAWNLVPKIREVDELLQSTPTAQNRVLEAHPELAFRALAGDPLQTKKSTKAGRRRRLDLLREAFPHANLEAAYRETLDQTYRKHVARDDVLDALVLAAIANGPLTSLPKNPPTDRTGLLMAIHVPLTTPK